MDVAFVILHYLTIKDTIEAIDSIKKTIKSSAYRIVVVDNGSNNGTGETLKEDYNKDPIVDVIISKENVGFARGNNIGFKYALHKWAPDFIILLNNDILMLQEDFIDRVKSEFQKSQFAVLGPMIITADGKKNSSPVLNAPVTMKAIIKNYKREKNLLLIEKLNLFWMRDVIINIKHRIAKNKTINDEYSLSRHEDVVLHGCCLIFSKEFYHSHSNGLDEGTFLYHEEEILFIMMKAEKKKMIYNPSLRIYHKEDAASNEMFPSEKKKRVFKLNNCIKSSERLIIICKENEHERIKK